MFGGLGRFTSLGLQIMALIGSNDMSTALTTNSSSTTARKEQQLRALLEAYSSVVVAYSGGVDSTYLAAVAYEALGERALIVTAQSPSMAKSEFEFARQVATDRGWNFRVVMTQEAEDERWLANDRDRCFYCKSEMFDVLDGICAQEGWLEVLYGAIPEDFHDVRPGHRAATQHNANAPLAEVGLTKKEIRLLSKQRGLPSWDKPQAACLASRFPTGVTITVDDLNLVDRAEAALTAYGFRGHRVRHHGEIARIELQSADWPKIADTVVRDSIVASLKSLGYKHVTIDLAGYTPAGQNT